MDQRDTMELNDMPENQLNPDILPPPPTDFVIITALEEELEAVLAHLPNHQKLNPSDEDIRVYYQTQLPTTFPDGTKGMYQVIIMSLLNMGRIEATIATSDAIRRWKPRYVIMVGIAGGLAANGVALGDVLLSNQVVDYELQKILPTGPQIRSQIHRSDPRLLGVARSISSTIWQQNITVPRHDVGQPKRHIGSIASGDKVVAVGEVLAKYAETWPKLIGVEMEAAGVATAAFQAANPPGFFMVRGVSDLADEGKGNPEVEEWREYACAVAAAYTVSLLQHGPVPLSSPSNKITGQPETLTSDSDTSSQTNVINFQSSNPIPPLPQDVLQQFKNLFRRSGKKSIFLAYVWEDRDRAKVLHQGLTDSNLKIWMDIEDLQGGDIWEEKIQKAIRSSDFFLACLSPNALKPDGYFREEIQQWLALSPEQGTLIPLRLENCKPPEILAGIHWIDLFAPDGWLKLFKTLHNRLKTQQGSRPHPGGTMTLDSPFYIEREADTVCWRLWEQTGGTTLFMSAPHQMGKSSLVTRLYDKAKKADKQIALIDFQFFSKLTLKDEEKFLKEICTIISKAVGLPVDIDQRWQKNYPHIKNCTRYITHYIGPKLQKPLILMMDRIERLINSPFRDDFFSMLRGWHEERAKSEVFAKISLFLSSAIDGNALISDPQQSPFNVAQPIVLNDFTDNQVADLNGRYGDYLTATELATLVDWLGGHPYLLHQSFHYMTFREVSLETLLTKAIQEDGPFENHLKHFLFSIDAQLYDALKHICQYYTYDDLLTYNKLHGLGLVKRDGPKVIFRNQLYDRYFKNLFGFA